ncbi:hypothetical protein GCT13_39880 [Paraburkholderia sp. CNPSo 3157]|uniref:Uncharacterized protein n=1 Tax=Paraburkholderia franconis TaxID=2654983 RepID=A0A7X1TKM7_9BURK|nr:hypothetical protein [Paraburkholderia franconis]MPW22800.1 hypothetical protein [Paraburkholderia franconis]
MLFNEKSNASGSLFRVSNDLLIDGCKLCVGGINVDDRNIVVASAEPRLICQYGENSVVTGTRFNGFGLALGNDRSGP